ncbi:MAG: hypothetical protein ACK559_27225, partial [bacterium]
HEHVYLKKIVSDVDSVIFEMENREDIRRNYIYEPDSNSWAVFHKSLPLKRYREIRILGRDVHSTLNKKIVFSQTYFNTQYNDKIADNQKEGELRWMRSRLDK